MKTNKPRYTRRLVVGEQVLGATVVSKLHLKTILKCECGEVFPMTNISLGNIIGFEMQHPEKDRRKLSCRNCTSYYPEGEGPRTEKARQAVQMLRQGLPPAEIHKQLNVSYATVEVWRLRWVENVDLKKRVKELEARVAELQPRVYA